jgi:hypothetical protein
MALELGTISGLVLGAIEHGEQRRAADLGIGDHAMSTTDPRYLWLAFGVLGLACSLAFLVAAVTEHRCHEHEANHEDGPELRGNFLLIGWAALCFLAVALVALCGRAWDKLKGKL